MCCVEGKYLRLGGDLRSMLKLSICIPTYNRPEYLKRAVNSVLNSAADGYEILVFDNSQNSESEAVVNSLSDPRIIYKRHSDNLGMLANWNALIEYSQGQYIKFLNDDDWFESGAVDLFFRDINRYKDAAVFNYSARYVNDMGCLVKADSDYQGKNVSLTGKEAAQIISAGKRRLGAPSQVMFRRDYALKAGSFGLKMSYSLDIRLWAKLLNYGNIVFINDEKPINILLHPNQAAKGFSVKQKIVDQQEVNKIIFDIFNSDADDKELSALDSFIAWHELGLALRGGDLFSAIKAFRLTNYNVSGFKEFVRRDIVERVQ